MRRLGLGLLSLALLAFTLVSWPPPKAAAATITCPDGTVVTAPSTPDAAEHACDAHSGTSTVCTPKASILGIPTWYKYLPGVLDAKGNCIPQLSCKGADANQTCKSADSVNVDASKIWLIGFAVLEMLLRLGGIVAVGIVIFGGFKYITSQGSPDATKGARQTIINGFIGIVILILATISVNFLAKLLQ